MAIADIEWLIGKSVCSNQISAMQHVTRMRTFRIVFTYPFYRYTVRQLYHKFVLDDCSDACLHGGRYYHMNVLNVRYKVG